MQQSDTRIQPLWQQLATVGAFFYSAQPGPRSQTGWAGQGNGQVTLEWHAEDELHFIEQGEFCADGGVPVAMFNRFIWQRNEQGIRLSHGRRGERVFLFELQPQADGCWRSVADHLCINDLYSGQLRPLEQGFELIWRINGPKKDECLVYQYTPDKT